MTTRNIKCEFGEIFHSPHTMIIISTKTSLMTAMMPHSTSALLRLLLTHPDMVICLNKTTIVVSYIIYFSSILHILKFQYAEWVVILSSLFGIHFCPNSLVNSLFKYKLR